MINTFTWRFVDVARPVVVALTEKTKNRLLPIFSPDFTLNGQTWLFYAEKCFFFFKKLGTPPDSECVKFSMRSDKHFVTMLDFNGFLFAVFVHIGPKMALTLETKLPPVFPTFFLPFWDRARPRTFPFLHQISALLGTACLPRANKQRRKVWGYVA